MWGTTGIGYNVKAVQKILGPDAKIDSWDVVFKPENLAKFKECGIQHAGFRPTISSRRIELSRARSQFDQTGPTLKKPLILLSKSGPMSASFIRRNT